MKLRLLLLLTLVSLCGCAEGPDGTPPVSVVEPEDAAGGKQGASEGREDASFDSEPLVEDTSLEPPDSLEEEEDVLDTDDSGGDGVDSLSVEDDGEADSLEEADVQDDGDSEVTDIATESDSIESDAELPVDLPGAPASGDLVMSEILIVGGVDGPYDPNEDGRSHPVQDEFVEIMNTSEGPIDLSGVQIREAKMAWLSRHEFGPGQILPPGEVWVIFGGGYPRALDPGTRRSVAHHQGKGLDLGLHLTDKGNRLDLLSKDGDVLDILVYGDFGGVEVPLDASLVRMPDGTWGPHSSVSEQGLPFSPGRTVEGEWFPSP